VEVGHAEALEGRGYAWAGLGRPEEAARALAAARDAYRAAQHHEMVAETGRNALAWVVLPYFADRLSERRRVLAEVEDAEARVAGMVSDRPRHYARRALLLPEGRWAEAADLAAVARARGICHKWLMGTVLLARLAREQGDRDLGRRLVREALPDGPASEPGDSHFLYLLSLQRVAADLALDADDLTTARAWLAAHDRWLAWAGAVLGRAEGALGWAACHRASGDLAAARRHAEAALSHASEPRQPLALLAAHRLVGELETQAGRHAEADVELNAALALADGCAVPYERALTLLARGELRAAGGRTDEARALLDEARAICVPLGAQPALARADTLAADLARGQPRAARYDPARLSPRETEVLRLLAAGRSNKEIAATLGMSVRTAERHIANLYMKIDAAGRAEAIAFAHRLGLI
jgi:DNA-binding CsgD family transcriptional regulator